MICPKCDNQNLTEGIYICTESDYRVIDSDGNLVFIYEVHDFLEGDDEINSNRPIKYCSKCKYCRSYNE